MLKKITGVLLAFSFAGLTWAQQIDLNKAMKVLSQAEREVIAHCYFADLSMEETAGVLSMPIGTVKTHSNRALIKLRIELQAWKKKEPI